MTHREYRPRLFAEDGDWLFAGVNGISVVGRLMTQHLHLTVHYVTWPPFLLPKLTRIIPPCKAYSVRR
jgi:hypothetical protein